MCFTKKRVMARGSVLVATLTAMVIAQSADAQQRFQLVDEAEFFSHPVADAALGQIQRYQLEIAETFWIPSWLSSGPQSASIGEEIDRLPINLCEYRERLEILFSIQSPDSTDEHPEFNWFVLDTGDLQEMSGDCADVFEAIRILPEYRPLAPRPPDGILRGPFEVSVESDVELDEGSAYVARLTFNELGQVRDLILSFVFADPNLGSAGSIAPQNRYIGYYSFPLRVGRLSDFENSR